MQQLYLWRLATCVAVQLTTRQQLERVLRDSNVRNAGSANVGDYLVLFGDGTAQMIAPDEFAQEWARPSTLLEPRYSELLQGIRELEATDLAARLEQSERTADSLGRQVMELTAELSEHRPRVVTMPALSMPRVPTPRELAVWECSCGHSAMVHHDVAGCCAPGCTCDQQRRDLVASWQAANVVDA